MMIDAIIHVLSERKKTSIPPLRKHNHVSITKQKYINADDYPSVYMTLQHPSEEY